VILQRRPFQSLPILLGVMAAIACGRAQPEQRYGFIIPYDRVWRTGANAATQFTTSAPVRLAGIQLSAGTYTLWTVPHQNGVDLIVNGQAGQWGTQYDRSRDVGTARLQAATVPTPVDQFTISVAANDDRHGTLILEWGSFRWTAPIEVQ
jgi:hypothetical protein